MWADLSGLWSTWAHLRNLWKTWAHTTHHTVVESLHQCHTLQVQTYQTWHQHSSVPVYLGVVRFSTWHNTNEGMTEPISVACGGHGPTQVSGMGGVSVWAHPNNLWKTWAHTTHHTVVESPNWHHTLQAQTCQTWRNTNNTSLVE